ncbi:MAG: hypothetical protein HC819_13245 [Cyclobacteriaceae bacterium]|nr:hypothetical protein [Cyclobacteriaceae bacterium]
MKRKLMNGMLALVLVAGFVNVYAQDVTDEDVKNYAIIELAKNSIIDGISPLVNEMIEKQEGMTGQRYQELQGAAGDAGKLAGIEAQEWEIKFYELVDKQIEKKKSAATDVVKLLASNAMGAASYKATKAAVDSDPAIKAKFEGYLAAFK